jgi:dihydroorotase
MSATLLITGGQVVDPVAGTVTLADVRIADGCIAAVGPAGTLGAADQQLDATGLLVLPGLVDIHVHLREPGFEYKETIATGVAAALAGGVTTVACMANTNPVNDNAAVTQYIRERGTMAAGARVYPIGAVSQGLQGERLAEIGEMHRAGIVAVSDDGMPIMDAGLMRRALEYTRLFDMPVIAHEDDRCLAAGGSMHEGLVSVRLGLRGAPEEVMVARDIALAELTGGHLHVAHVSTAGSVALIREAKVRGVHVTTEATPHHLFLTDDAVDGYKTHAKMAPPLRTRADVDALRAGLADGTIEAIATDHAPHHSDEKDCEFEQAANGIIGLETALPLGLQLVAEGVLDLPTLVRRMTCGPAAILRLPGGTLAPGAAADVTLVDPSARFTYRAAEGRSKSRNTPFDGHEFVGRASTVLVGGRIVFDRNADRSALRSAS